jgi:hypothetical protein
MNALDLINASSCWNSEGSDDQSEQWIQLDFGREVRPRQLRIQFQAGFSAQACKVLARLSNGESENRSSWEKVDELELSDAYDVQVRSISETLRNEQCTSLRFVFEEFSDFFYGRVIIYQLEIWGEEGSGQ